MAPSTLTGQSPTGQSPRITNVVFDMGGVLTIDPYQGCIDYAAELGLPRRTFADLLFGSQFHEVETGVRTMRDFLKFACTTVAARFGNDIDIRRLAAAFAAGQEFRPEMALLVQELASTGVQIGLLTNNAKEARSWWTSGAFPVEAFSVVLDSSEIGLRKPDPEVFMLVASRLGCDPANVVFFDDTEVNVTAAASVGMTSVLFENPDQCRRELEGHRLL
jgi:epoxide hydrolase-like predicted phosphatase